MIRVVLVAEQLRRRVPGGIGTCVRGLVAGWHELGGAGPRLTLWASRAPGRGPDPLASLGPVQASALPGPALVRAWDRGLVRPPRGHDVVLAPSLATPPAREPLVTCVWDLTWRRLPGAFPSRGRRWHEAALGRALARSRLLVVPSAATADDLLGAGAAPDRVVVVEPGADHLPPPDEERAGALLDELGVEGPFVLTVSTLEPRKNLGRLVAAHEQARSRLGGWPLLVVGPAGWGPPSSARPGVASTGWVEGAVLAGLYRRAGVVASVPLVEGYGMPVAEAMRAGVPVVSSPVPAAGPAAGAATLVVDPTDVGALAEALVVAATDEGRRTQLVAAGRARTEAATWRRAGEAYLEVLASALDRPPTNPDPTAGPRPAGPRPPRPRRRPPAGGG